MSTISLRVDGRAVDVEKGSTILDAARVAGVPIPTLCHHEKLAPYGGCRLCIVEAEVNGRAQTVASCVYPAEQGMEVRTRSEKIDRIRRTLIELFLARAPESPPLVALAKEYGAEADRFEKDASFCVHCGLCVRYCAEIKGAHAVGFIDRGPKKEICFVFEIAAKECDGCKECFELCPTSYLQAAYVLARALISAPGREESSRRNPELSDARAPRG